MIIVLLVLAIRQVVVPMAGGVVARRSSKAGRTCSRQHNQGRDQDQDQIHVDEEHALRTHAVLSQSCYGFDQPMA